MKQRKSELKTGEVVSTKAGKLKCKTIIHAVGPVWNNGRDLEMDYLSRAVRNCLADLEEKSYTSIAIPAISTETTSFNASLLGPQQKAAPMTPRTNVASGENAGIKINLMPGSISNASVDVIVNSSNEELQLDKGSISKLILNTAGPEIQNECYQKYPQGISTSKIAVTKGYNLKCKNVFHLALPPWDENSPDSILANLTQIITTCLETAEKMGAKSLAFPILGAGKLSGVIGEFLVFVVDGGGAGGVGTAVPASAVKREYQQCTGCYNSQKHSPP
ncbi:Hypothetical predicted protein [Octopus vulgaris]|uniref:Macro domain-containing protein n=1 Tax=Octopus vulgaris TaxID=6645 RepID=A0AA36EWL5_OCTVU|nr:Hypothetical predicted protein [Octopus vulgaris]